MSSYLYLETAPDGSPFEDGETLEFDSEEMRDDIRTILESRGADARIPDENGEEEEELAADGGIGLDRMPSFKVAEVALREIGDRDGDGVPEGEVVEWTTARTEWSPDDIRNALTVLENRGDVYQVNGCYKRTLPNDGGSR